MTVAMWMLALAASQAHAASGTIGFSGAVLAPTCAVTAPPTAMRADAAPVLQACGRGAADAVRSYAQAVVTLDAGAVSGDRLLDYYAGHAPHTGTSAPVIRLVVRTYL